MDALERKKLYLDILIGMANADGEADETQEQMLTQIGAQMGVGEDCVAKMMVTPRTMDVIEAILRDIQDDLFKRSLLKDCYLLAYADDEIVDAEDEFLQKVKGLLELGDPAMDEIHNWVKTAIEQQKKAATLFGE